MEARDRNQLQIYALTLGQCSQALRNQMEAHHDWTAIDEAPKVIGMLRTIQICMTLCQTRKHEVHSLFGGEAFMLNYKQSKQTLNHKYYYEKFKDSVATAERLGSDIGLHHDSRIITSILNHIAVNPDVPTAVERTTARNTAKDEYMVICFLMNSNKRRYGGLIHDIESEHTRGSNTYPNTLTGAYD